MKASRAHLLYWLAAVALTGNLAAAAPPEPVTGYELPADQVPRARLHKDTSSYEGVQYEDFGYEDPGFEDAVLPPAEDWNGPGFWYGQADVLVLHRSRPEERAIGRDLSSDRDLDQYGRSIGIEPGMRLTLGTSLGYDEYHREHQLEASFLGLIEFESTDSIESVAPRSLIALLRPTLGGFTGADEFTTQYESALNSFEVNKRIRRKQGRDALIASPDGSWTRAAAGGHQPSLLFGVRGLSLDEDFQFTSHREGISTDVFSGNWRTETDNQLWGLQVGGDWIDYRDRWYWGVRGKAGLYANFAEQSTRIVTVDPLLTSVDESFDTDDTNVAFFGEFGLLAVYQLRPDLSLRASYDFMVLAGVALAPEQLTEETATPVVKTDGDIFYQGLSLGVEYVW